MGRYDLTDREGARLEPLLPPRRPRIGRPNHDHRRIVSGILRVPRTGAPRRDLPERHGPVGTVSSRFHRWRAAGVWGHVLARLRAEADAKGGIDRDLHLVDATIVRAHRHAAGARRAGAVGGCGRGRGAGPLAGRVLDHRLRSIRPRSGAGRTACKGSTSAPRAAASRSPSS